MAAISQNNLNSPSLYILFFSNPDTLYTHTETNPSLQEKEEEKNKGKKKEDTKIIPAAVDLDPQVGAAPTEGEESVADQGMQQSRAKPKEREQLDMKDPRGHPLWPVPPGVNLSIRVVAFFCVGILPLGFSFRDPTPVLSMPPILQREINSSSLRFGLWHLECFSLNFQTLFAVR